MAGYRDLEVYNVAHNLGVDIHRFSLKLPKFELYESGAQMRRSSKSISANIVEGYGRRRYRSDYVKFLVYAQSSCDETNEWLTYAVDLYRDLREEARELLVRIDRMGKQLNSFIKVIENRNQ